MLKMEKMRGAMWIIFVFFLLNAARSQEIADSKCSIEFDGECVKRVSCTVETNVVKEKSELFVSYKNQEQIEEGIADCKWSLETFYCDPSKGYFCELRMPTNFSIFINTTARCVTSGQFIIDAANQQSIKCNVSEYKRNTPDQFNQSVSTTTSGDTVNEAIDNTIVGAVIGGFVILLVVGVGILLWIKMCRKPRQGPEGNNTTSDSVGKTPQETTTCLTESEKNDHRKWTCVEKLRQLWFPGSSASGSSVV